MTESSKAVFLSYASQDAEAARHIADALRAAGVEVWFDQSELRGGDVWDRQIREHIQRCALFVPIISNTTQGRLEGYFRREWKLAVDRTHDMADAKPFLVPVVIDNTKDQEAEVPELFRAVQWTRLPEGETPPAFVERVSRLLSPEAARAPAAVRSTATAAPHTTAAPRQSAASPAAPRLTKRVLVVIAAVAVIAVGYFVIDKLVLSKRVAETGRASAASVQSIAPAPSAIPEKSIAVLPFLDMSEKKDQEYFSDGLAEELLDLLAQVPDLKVPARTSSFYFKGKQVTVAEIAKALGVAHVLEGSVRKSGHTIRVTTQLIRADNGFHLWSKSYDRDAQDIFKVQDEIADSVVQALKTKLLPHAQSGERTTANIDAYTLMLQGRYLIGHGSEADLRQALLVLKRGVTLDPEYAAAWTELARAYSFFSDHIDSTPQVSAAQARASAEKAVALDPTSADALTALAYVKLSDFDWQGYSAEMELAARADPTTPRLNWMPLYSGCTAGPCYKKFIGDLSRIIERDPLNATAHRDRAKARVFGGELEAAERDERRALELSPRKIGGYLTLVLILIARHDLGNLLATAELEPPGPMRRWALALAYQALGRQGEADRALKDFIAQDANNWACQIGQIFARRGELAQAFSWLERAYRQHDEGLLELKVDPEFASIRGDPRYKALLRKMNLPE